MRRSDPRLAREDGGTTPLICDEHARQANYHRPCAQAKAKGAADEGGGNRGSEITQQIARAKRHENRWLQTLIDSTE
jgi:hypothetical protein